MFTQEYFTAAAERCFRVTFLPEALESAPLGLGLAPGPRSEIARVYAAAHAATRRRGQSRRPRQPYKASTCTTHTQYRRTKRTWGGGRVQQFGISLSCILPSCCPCRLVGRRPAWAATSATGYRPLLWTHAFSSDQRRPARGILASETTARAHARSGRSA